MTGLLIVLLLGVVYRGLSAHSAYDEYRLHKDLFTSYNPRIRPVKYSESTVNVRLLYYLAQVGSLDEKTQVLATTVWFDVTWDNELLSWNSSEYNGTTWTIVDQAKIWTPDLVIDNSLNDVKSLINQKDPAIIYNTGHVLVRTTKELKTNCDVNVKNYPFDSQVCHIKITKVVTNDAQIMVNADDENAMLYFKENGQWNVHEPRQLSVLFRAADNFTVTTTIWAVRLSRRSEFYVINIILPVILFSFMNCCAYLLPLESGEKISFCVTMFLSLSVFLTLVSNSMPQTSTNMSHLAIYLSFQLCSSASVVIAEMLVLHVYYKTGTCAVPRACRYLCCPRIHDSNHGNGDHTNKSTTYHDVARFLDRALLITTTCVNVAATLVFMLQMM